MLNRVYALAGLEPMSPNNDETIREEDESEENEFDDLVIGLLRRLYRQEPFKWNDYYRQAPQHADELKYLRPAIEAVASYLRQKSK